MPSTTLLVSEHLPEGEANIASAVYAGSFSLLSIAWIVIWRNASHNHRLIDEDIPRAK